MKVPQPELHCYYIQQMYPYGWDYICCDFNYDQCMDQDSAIEFAREYRDNHANKVIRLVKVVALSAGLQMEPI